MVLVIYSLEKIIMKSSGLFFFHVGVLLLVHFMKFPVVKPTKQTNKSLFCLFPITNKKTCPYIVQILEFVE